MDAPTLAKVEAVGVEERETSGMIEEEDIRGGWEVIEIHPSTSSMDLFKPFFPDG